MRLGLLVALILAGGCRQIFGVDSPGPVAADGAPDTFVPPDDASDASGRACFGVDELGLTACVDQVLPPLVASIDMAIDTGDMALCAAADPPADVCVVAASSVSIPAGLHITVIGSRPLVVYSTHEIAIAGTLDVASHVGGALGAGANPMSCIVGTLPSGAGGGAGGSFATRGGRGGVPSLLIGGSPGASAGPMTIATLRGGCPGQDGGGASGGGAGGGAVLLVAAEQIELAGSAIVNASGQSGDQSASPSHGGNGGGAGGMIAMAAPSISVAPLAQVFANGGHGGGGANSVAPGSAGVDPTGATSGGSGGVGGGQNGGPGGTGYPATAAGGDAVSSGQGGGGGGGGGAGVIRLFTANAMIGGAISPPPS